MTTWKQDPPAAARGNDRGWRAGTRRSTVDPRLSRPDRERRGGGRASADARQRCRDGPAHNPAMRGRRLRLLDYNSTIRRTGWLQTPSMPVAGPPASATPPQPSWWMRATISCSVASP